MYTYNHSYLRGTDRQIKVQGQQGKKHETLSEKQTKSKKGWSHGSSGGPEFKTQYGKK
jgi:hypothetical protein